MWKKTWSNIVQYPSALAGILVILFLLGLSVYSLVTISYSDAVYLWRGGEGVWAESPRNAVPRWFNWFPGVNIPETIVLSSQELSQFTKVEELPSGIFEITMEFPFTYTYDGFPKEVQVMSSASYDTRKPHVTMTWHTPDGREIAIGERAVERQDTYRVSQDTRLLRRLRTPIVEHGLFGDPTKDTPTSLKGDYRFVVQALTFDAGSELEVKLVVYGQAHGLAGTDHRRRDLTIALLWGTPIALAFGFLAAIGSTISTMMIAAIGVWYGRWIDATIQRITEVNMILPMLPILIMIGTLYSKSIWLILGTVIALSIFSAGIKTYRAMFLQVKESPYIEAAKAYGASNMRIVFKYMIPRVIPVLVPSFVVMIPSYVFLEATLAVLGLGDPILPTWGKVLNDAHSNGALHNGYYYWVLLPSALLMLTGLGFSMFGFALDRIFNPRLRGL